MRAVREGILKDKEDGMKKAIGLAVPLGRVVVFVGIAPRKAESNVLPYKSPKARHIETRKASREPVPA